MAKEQFSSLLSLSFSKSSIIRLFYHHACISVQVSYSVCLQVSLIMFTVKT